MDCEGGVCELPKSNKAAGQSKAEVPSNEANSNVVKIEVVSDTM